jgi:hypothetical protein
MKPSVCYKRQADQETTSEDLYGSYIPLLLTYDCGLSIDWHAHLKNSGSSHPDR